MILQDDEDDEDQNNFFFLSVETYNSELANFSKETKFFILSFYKIARTNTFSANYYIKKWLFNLSYEVFQAMLYFD